MVVPLVLLRMAVRLMLWARGFLLLGFSSSASTSSWESLLHLTLGAGNVVFVTLAGVAKYAMKHWMQQRLELQTKVPEDYVKMEDITNMEQKASARVFFAYWHFHISHGK